MQSFKIKQNGFKELKKKFLKRMIPTLVIATSIGIVMSTINSNYKDVGGIFYFAFIPVIFLVSGFSLYRGLQKQKVLLESYELTISENLVVREQLNTQDIAIYIKEVQEIVKHKNGSFTIRGKEAKNLIIVPAQIDNYEQLELTLQQIHPITTKAKEAYKQKIQAFLGFVTIGSMICVYAASNKILVGVAGTVFAVFSIWGLKMIQTSKNIDRKTKNKMWISLIVIASVIGVTIMKLATDMP